MKEEQNIELLDPNLVQQQQEKQQASFLVVKQDQSLRSLAQTSENQLEQVSMNRQFSEVPVFIDTQYDIISIQGVSNVLKDLQNRYLAQSSIQYKPPTSASKIKVEKNASQKNFKIKTKMQRSQSTTKMSTTNSQSMNKRPFDLTQQYSTKQAYQDKQDIQFVESHIKNLRKMKSVKSFKQVPKAIDVRQYSRKKTLKYIKICLENARVSQVQDYRILLVIKLNFNFQTLDGKNYYLLDQSQTQPTKAAFYYLNLIKKQIPPNFKMQYGWLKNSLFLDYISYELLKNNCQTNLDKQFTLIVKSIKQTIRKGKNKKSEVALIYKYKLKLVLESTINLYVAQENQNLSNLKVLELIYQKVQSDFIKTEVLFSLQDIQRIESLCKSQGFEGIQPQRKNKNQQVKLNKLIETSDSEEIESVQLNKNASQKKLEQLIPSTFSGTQKTSFMDQNAHFIPIQVIDQPMTPQEQVFQELSRVIRMNKQKELDLDFQKFSMDGCFEAMIVAREEFSGFKEYFKLKKDLQEGNFDRKALGTWEDIHALLFMKNKKNQEKKEEKEFLRMFQLGKINDQSQEYDSETDGQVEIVEIDQKSEKSSLATDDSEPIKDSREDKMEPKELEVRNQELPQLSQAHIKSAPPMNNNSSSSSPSLKPQFSIQKTQKVQSEKAKSPMSYKNKIELKKLQEAFQKKQAQSKDVESAKQLQQTLIQKLNFKKQSLLDVKTPSNLDEMREKFGDVLKFEITEKTKNLRPHESTMKFLRDFKNENDRDYWGKMIFFNKTNHAFREVFQDHMELGNKDQRLNQIKLKFQNSREKFLNKFVPLKQKSDNDESSRNSMYKSNSSTFQGGNSINKGHSKKRNSLQTNQQQSDIIEEENHHHGYSIKQVHKLRDKVHRDNIKETIELKREDMNLMIKNYNMTKSIFDQEEMREMQSTQQRRNLVKVLKNSKTTSFNVTGTFNSGGRSKNNEVESSSEFGGITDRGNNKGGYVSGRSYDTFTGDSIFEDRLIGSNGKICGMRNDIIEISNLNDVPLELMGDTGLQDFEIELKQGSSGVKHDFSQQLRKTPDLTISQNSYQSEKQSNNQVLNQNNLNTLHMSTLHMSDLQSDRNRSIRQSHNSKEEIKNDEECRDMYQKYLKNKFSKKRVDDNLLDEIIKRKNDFPSHHQRQDSQDEKENIQRDLSNRVVTRDVVGRSYKNNIMKRVQEQLDSFRQTKVEEEIKDDKMSCHELKDKLREIMNNLKQNQSKNQMLNDEFFKIENWNTIENFDDFVSMFSKIKENMILLQQKCTQQEDTIQQQQMQLNTYKNSELSYDTQIKALQEEVENLSEQILKQKQQYKLDLEQINTSANEKIYLLNSQLITLKRDISKIKEENQIEIDKIQKYNHKLIEKLERGQAKYENICHKYKQIKDNEKNKLRRIQQDLQI
ncbi:UNKNOWN [Stylonychia lemnae]|uniref:Uncharacterized protein n=1 Tax=Stylonychia lemnae TaxID=5949 RepID=A0A078BA70_STYLE|nr:UNKNOWN [Stylonychia lemnae]|eukprot:CDW90172.1 UNKNOWN [Stylonychia lemnae]